MTVEESSSSDMHARLAVLRVGLPGVVALTLAAGVPVVAGAIGSQGDPRTVWDGVYTAEQAARGKAVYDANCISCHQSDLSGSSEARSLVGESFMQDWREDNLNTLFTRISQMMPFDDPATLSDRDYTDSVAYILQYNAFPAGTKELTPDGLEDIQIVGKDGPGPVPSFALVQVIGCLAHAEGNSWSLTSSTEPVRSSDPAASSPDELTAFASAPLGTQTFDLLSVYVSPETHDGRRVEVKGFLIRLPEENRINVSSLEVVAPTCPN